MVKGLYMIRFLSNPDYDLSLVEVCTEIGLINNVCIVLYININLIKLSVHPSTGGLIICQ